MKNINVFAALVLFAVVSCVSCDGPPPPPPCDGMSCDKDCTLNVETCECECPEPPSPPPPPPGPDPRDYKRIEVTRAEADWLESNDGLPDHIWTCVRNPEYAIRKCGACIGPIVDVSELKVYVAQAKATHQRVYDEAWLGRLRAVNRRCGDLENPDPEDAWCKRSNIRREVFTNDYMPLKQEMLDQIWLSRQWMIKASNLWGIELDGWKHWCRLIDEGAISCKP